MFKKILIPVDGSDLSARAADCGIRLAKEMNATVIFVHAMAPYIVPYAADVALMDSKTQKLFEEEVLAGSQKLLDDVAKLAASAGVTSESVHAPTGRPEVLIEKTVREQHCDLVVIATHGRGAVGRFVMGSVTTRLLPSCTVPVLVYRDASMGIESGA
jgi:nucleotide-binding universal stress UspA family protein